MIADILGDGNWYHWTDLTADVAQAYQLQPQTVSKLLQGIVKTGGIERHPAQSKRGEDMTPVIVKLR